MQRRKHALLAIEKEVAFVISEGASQGIESSFEVSHVPQRLKGSLRTQMAVSGWFSGMPPEILDSIVQSLPTRQIIKLSTTCKCFYAICNQEALWKRKWLSGYHKEATFEGDWKALMLSIEGAAHETIAAERQKSRVGPPPGKYHQRLWFRCHCDPISLLARHTSQPVTLRCKGDGLPGASQYPEVWSGLMDTWSTDKWMDPHYLKPLLQTKFRVAKSYGGSCFMTLSDYLRYASLQHDEEPLYIFDEGFAERAPCLASDYAVPEGTPQDMFEIMGPGRPDYRWLIMGPKRSGSSWHQDPTGTCAWNALVAGTKRWLLYPPNVLPPGVSNSVTEDGDQDVGGPNPLEWLLSVYPYLSDDQLPLEHIQRPGEIVFLPSGWWHCIINTSDTIAVTQNYVPFGGLEGAVRELAWGSGHKLKAQQRTGSEVQSCAGEPRREVGFCRSMHLGAWLSKLAKEEPGLEEALMQLAERYCSVERWRTKLDKVTAACGLESLACRRDALPVRGGQTVIFRIQEEAIVKFYAKDAQEGLLDAYTELSALQALSACPERSPSVFPRLLKASFDHPDEILTATSEGDPNAAWGPPSLEDMPWVALEFCRGQPVSSASMTPSVAGSIGCAVAQVHQASDGTQPFFKDEDAWDSAIGSQSPCMWQGGSPWDPFLRFLRRRRGETHSQLFASAALPIHLLEQLDTYLPQDADVLCVGALANSQGPCLLHGDLTPENILLDRGPDEADLTVRLIDFGDSGYGDPLYDVLPLFVATLRCNAELLRAYLTSYYRSMPDGTASFQNEEPKLSYRAMCYMLLHEQELFSVVFEQRPRLWQVSSLHHLQEALWGCLDSLTATAVLA